jgi:hypothetical protein
MDIENFIKTIQPPIYKRMIKIPEHVAKIFGIESVIVITSEFTHITQILHHDKDVVLTSEMCELLDCSATWQGLSFRDLMHNREKIYSTPQSKHLQCEFLKRAIQIVYTPPTDSNTESKVLANEVLVNTSAILARSFRKYFECPFKIVTHPPIKDGGQVYLIYQDEKIVGGIKDLDTCKKIVNRLNVIVQSCVDLSTCHTLVNDILHTSRDKFTHRPIYRFELLKLYKL